MLSATVGRASRPSSRKRRSRKGRDAGDSAFLKDLRRLAKVDLNYRETQEAEIPAN